MAQIVKRIVLGLTCLLVVTAIAFWGMRSSAQQSFPSSRAIFSLAQPSTRLFLTRDIEYASVNLDGYSLFQIALQKASSNESEINGDLSLIERRARRIEGTLDRIVNQGFEPQTLQVRTATLNNLKVIVASDNKNLSKRVILTVTEIDALIETLSVADLAEQWSQIIHNALIQAFLARQPEARTHQISTVATIAIGMTIISYLLAWGQNFLKTRFNRLKKRAKEQSSTLLESDALSSPDEANHFFLEPLAVLSAFRQQANLQKQLILNILLQRLDKIGLILL